MNLNILNLNLKLLTILASTAVVAGGATYVATKTYQEKNTVQETTQTQYQYKGINEQNRRNNTNNYGPNQDHNENIKNLVNQHPSQELNEKEVEHLIYMREEEKLARDVYLTLADKWGDNTFSNIAKSEQRHTDAIKALIEKYNLEDPVKDDSIGVFTNTKLAELYSQLVDQGSKSLVDALKVGATIEDLDISDLDKALADTDNKDITQVFEYLRNGSYNHIKAFVSKIEDNGAEYSPQFITQEEYDKILNSTTTRGHGRAIEHDDTDTNTNDRGMGRGRGMGMKFNTH